MFATLGKEISFDCGRSSSITTPDALILVKKGNLCGWTAAVVCVFFSSRWWVPTLVLLFKVGGRGEKVWDDAAICALGDPQDFPNRG